MNVPVELLIADGKNHRKLISVVLKTRNRDSLFASAQAYVRAVWRGWNLVGVQEGRLFQD